MPIEIVVDAVARRVTATVHGTFETDDMTRAIDASVAHPSFRPGFGILSTHVRLTEPLTPAQARLLVGHLERHADALAGCRWAVIADGDASYGMLRMVSALGDGLPMKIDVFRTAAEAVAWLDGGDDDDGAP